jgi:chromosome segregation ATPase
MEVISGMAPRPVTPSGHGTSSSFPQRPASAPNSPARGYSGGKAVECNNNGGVAAFGFGGIINRLPSQDSLDRSIHNESGHGKSTAQIVRDLKHSNSALSAKMASLEKKHMNELSDITRSFEKRQAELELANKTMKKQLQQLDAYKASSELKLKEKELALSKVKEESAFQRHTISGLKNDLYQLQTELDELQYEGQGVNGDKPRAKERVLRTNVEREIEDLQSQLMAYQGYEAKFQDMQRQLEEANRKAEVAAAALNTSSRSIRPPLAPSSSRDNGESSLQSIHNDKESATEVSSKAAFDLEVEMENKTREWEQREADLLAKLDQKENIEKQLEEKVENISELEEKLDQYTEKLSELATALAEARQSAKNQEQYRADEAEDLRILHDAQEEQIAKLQKELDDTQRELDLREEELEEMKQNALAEKVRKSAHNNEDEKKVEDTDGDNSNLKDAGSIGTENVSPKIVMDLKEQLYNSTETVNKLEQQIEELKSHHSQVKTNLEREKEDVLVELKNVMTKKVGRDDEFSSLQSHWEKKSNAVAEVESLKKEIATLLQRVHDSSEAEKAAQKEVQHLQAELRAMESKITAGGSLYEPNSHQVQEAAESSRELELARQEVAQSSDENQRLRCEVEELHRYKDETASIKQQLEEAQIALVSLDEEKQSVEIRLKREVEKKDIELSKLQAIATQLELLQSKHTALEDADDDETNAVDLNSHTETEQARKIRAKVSELSAQNDMLLTKLKDRDTTISTLVRSSVALEKKIASLEGQVQMAKSQQRRDGPDDIPNSTRVQSDDDAKFMDQLNYLKKELRIAKADAKRWKRALKDDGTPGSEYRIQISMLQKANEDYAETIQERDQAIQNLVSQSMAQEAHVRDLKTRVSSLMKEVETVRMQKGRHDDSSSGAEIRRLQEESEIFAGQIIEQDEELKRMQRDLKVRDEMISTLKKELADINIRAKVSDRSITIIDDPGMHDELKATKSILAARDAQLTEQGVRIEELTMQAALVSELKAELDEMQDAAESNRVELRELRTQLWESKNAAGSTNDLRLELEQAQYALSEFKRQHLTAAAFSNEDRIQLESTIKYNAELLQLKNEMESKVNTLEGELQDRDAVIQNLRLQLSDVCSSESDEMRLSQEAKDGQIKALQSEIRQSQQDLNEARSLVQANELTIESVEQQLACSHNEVLSLQEQLEAKSSTENTLLDQLKSSQNEVQVFREKLESEMTRFKSLDQSVSTLQQEVENLHKELDGRSELVVELEARLQTADGQLKVMQSKVDRQSKEIDDLQALLTTKESGLKDELAMKAALVAQVSDSQARLGALEKELAEAASASSSNEDLMQKNRLLAVENASLSQKNDTLASSNAELAKKNSLLSNQVSSITKDNEILCGELQSLGERHDALNEAHEALKNDYSSFSVNSNSEKVAQEKENDEIRCHISSLEHSMNDLQQAKEALENEVTSLSQSIRNLEQEKSSAVIECDSLRGDISSLKNELQCLATKHTGLVEKQVGLQEQLASSDLNKQSLEEENESLKTTVQQLQDKNLTLSQKTEEMTKTIQSLRGEVESISERILISDELKSKLDEARQAREASEKSMVETYEKQMTALSTEKDAEIDALQRSLTESRGRTNEEMEEMIMQMKAMEEEASGMQEQYELELQAKDQQIYALEQTLHAQEQIVDSMRAEMDQLQSGMEHATKSRRGEVEEMQQEVMQVEARAMRQEREIVQLKILLDENKLQHKAEVVQLKEALAAATDDSPLKKTLSDLQNNDRMLEVRERLEQLKARNTALQEENLKLGGRLERAAIQINAFELEKKHAAEIEEENGKIRQQLKQYEQLLSQTASKRGIPPSTQENTSGDGDINTPKLKGEKQKKKAKFGLFKRRNIDEAIAEEKDEEEI